VWQLAGWSVGLFALGVVCAVLAIGGAQATESKVPGTVVELGGDGPAIYIKATGRILGHAEETGEPSSAAADAGSTR
jgi:hypothetical protein